MGILNYLTGVKVQVVESKDREAFEKIITEMIGNGWVPEGGISIAYDVNNNITYCQLMIRSLTKSYKN